MVEIRHSLLDRRVLTGHDGVVGHEFEEVVVKFRIFRVWLVKLVFTVEQEGIEEVFFGWTLEVVFEESCVNYCDVV
ncbi:hypothetical protein D3C87_2168610 [compost metagenome]